MCSVYVCTKDLSNFPDISNYRSVASIGSAVERKICVHCPETIKQNLSFQANFPTKRLRPKRPILLYRFR